MKWFKPKYSICQTCQVHYEPSKDSEGFKEFCSIHREPKVREYRRYKHVMHWADRNWEILEKKIEQEQTEMNKQTQQQMMGLQNALGQAATYAQSKYGPFGGT